jgi:signal transduction histidine kinase
VSRRAFPAIATATRLRWLLGLMFLGLAIPSALLIRQGFVRLELEEFRRQQLIAEAVLGRIDAALDAAIEVENARPVTDFQFAVTAPAGNGNSVQLSPLSSIAPAGGFPGTIGYFQVDAAGQLSTPLLPESERERSSLESDQIRMKVAVERQVAEVLEANQLVSNADAPRAGSLRGLNFDDADFGTVTTDAQGGFDRLAQSSALRRAAESEPVRAPSPAADEVVAAAETDAAAAEPLTAVRVASFAGEIEPLRFGVLETGHIVLFRNAWRGEQRYIQGLLVDRGELIRQSFAVPFRQAGLAAGSQLAVSIAGEAVSNLGLGADDALRDGSALYAARLSPPLSDIALEFTAGRLDRGPGFGLLVWTAIALFAVLVGGFVSMYLFGMQQLKLAREQRSFVSAISHELKTPLTSIRMYGEMLKSGWADEAKKQTYYDFIVDEGERLSRLIENVLQLSRLNNGGPTVAPVPVSVGEIFDLLRSKLVTQAERAGFRLEFDAPAELHKPGIAVNVDALTQVFINLVDNAIKYSGGAAEKTITLGVRRQGNSQILLTVRDYGPGVPPAALKRLFELFYRPDNELTRETSGTGIGLALVRQLVTAMGGRVDLRNCEPGAEFRLSFPIVPIAVP